MPRWIDAATHDEEEEATTSEEGSEDEKEDGINQASESEEDEEDGSAHNIVATTANGGAKPKQKISITLGKQKGGLCCHVSPNAAPVFTSTIIDA